ncbi:hypothetical protein FRB90_001700 [Tulasnella sp. 427]|nr:hypothetical protein FRB90_001700 [Tulasnella sp. 427]
MPQCMQKGFKACPRYSGRGGFDCVDTENDPESCGGCLTVDGKGDGKDCTAVKGVSVTRCVEGGCVIDSCRRGWKKSLDGKTCTSVSGGPGTSSSSSHHSGSNLHVQGVNAQKPKKFRTTAKRAIHPKIY